MEGAEEHRASGGSLTLPLTGTTRPKARRCRPTTASASTSAKMLRSVRIRARWRLGKAQLGSCRGD